ncbi:membrane protein [Cohnella kolymensis]|uniref:Membrane protein n=1 Tax=Cohnella kolymensis TaxID=1590652 RepID=A0ABR5A809_9BACL|nr:M23 family metallopeptidase [Cohnella kolymensis]KIL36715.1 membrane protein [Cohnella kolymensis]
MRRKFVLLLAMLITASLILQPYEGQALSEVQKIDKELKQLKNQMDAAEHNQRYADKTIKDKQVQVKATDADLHAILAKIDQESKVLQATLTKLDQSQEQLQSTVKKYKDAIKQKENHGKLMDSRLVLQYENGPVAYLDVLLSFKSFGEFVGHIENVEAIAAQDKDILNTKQKLEANLEAEKQEFEQAVAEVKKLSIQRQSNIASLENMENEKEVLMSQLNKEIEEMEEISEEAEAQLKEFAKKASQLEAKKKRIKNHYKGGKLGMPLQSDYRMSSPFGYRIHPITGKKKLHSGMDMAAPRGTPVYAAESGVVIVAQSWSGYGNCIVIDHGGGISTLYGHLMSGGIYVKKGQIVKRGQKIGGVGSTGQSTGNHLHFEVRNKDFEPVNPAPYLR